MMEEPRFPEDDADSEAARRARDDEKDNWEIDGILWVKQWSS